MTDINDLAEQLYANAREKGFYDHEDSLRNRLALSQAALNHQRPETQESKWGSANAVEQDKTILTEHFGNRLMLIAGEAVEAHEELRSGHGVAELYFTEREDNHQTPYEWPVYDDDQEKLRKPEGVLAELADIAIRTLETMASILALASDEEKAKLRAQVPQNEATALRFAEDNFGNRTHIKLEEVNVGEVIILKHDYNLSRAKMNGGRKF